MGRVCVSMEKWYLSDPVCHISTKIVVGQVVQLGPMEYLKSFKRGRANEAFDFLGTGLHFNHDLTQIVEWRGQAVSGKVRGTQTLPPFVQSKFGIR